ncbi:hypothetical protein [Leptospira noguchii]|uniref:hypothetical protein n=1 Tax=Leptospira noguchii TaxID=28182 RepID=UPI0009E437AF|nr:hypothetical protein [Leptospira noguchii]
MLRSIVSSIKFEKFRRNWSENEQLSVSLSHSPWVVRSNSLSHSPWVVRSNSASHSPWVVRQVVSQSTMKFASCDDDP